MTGRKSVALLCLAGVLCFSQPAWAAPFPNKTKDVVQDGNNYLVKKDREAFAESLKQFPDKYKVVVVESTAPEAKSADEYAKLLYDNYNLDADTMMIVLDYNTQQLGVYPGETLQAKGAKMEMLHEKIISYYEPFRNQKNYLDGIKTFITEVNNEYDRIKTQGESAATAAAGAEGTSKAADASKTKSVMSDIPLWLYGVGVAFVALVVAFIYSYIRRRQVFIELDDTEDWKDELVDKIQQIEVDKSLRRSAGKQDEWMVELANRKEHLLHVRIIDTEMMIMEAEEACDRFRFTKARALIAECQETLEAIEAELGALKQDAVRMIAGHTERVAPGAERAQSAEPRAAETLTQTAPQQTRKMPKTMPQAAPSTDEPVQVPAIGKLIESVERKLTNLRLEYGLSFHELKVQLDQVEHMRTESEAAAAAGDEAAQIRLKMGQQQLQELAKTLEAIPALVHKIEKELVEDLKQLEEGIVNASSDGFDLGANDLDAALLQVKTVLKEARSALEEGHIEKATKLVGVFTISLEKTYERIEDSLVGKKEAAATGPAASTINRQAEEAEIAQPSVTEELDAAREELLGRTVAYDEPARQAEPLEPTVAAEPEPEPEWIKAQAHESRQEPRQTIRVQQAAPERKETARKHVQEDEYELVIPKMETGIAPQKAELVIQSEDDVLDELERINGVLLRIRQQLKRSYLPGIPDQLKYYFEQSVHNLGQITITMERYKYSLEEVTVLLNEANELLAETELLAERTISTCQSAEGAIQYTNRYRRQNRQVNELLTKAEQAFRQLEFAEALRLAEEARLIVEGGEPQTAESRWLLRKKKKGLEHDTR
ncbi:septation ring formation regulator EzrA [Brevibacillus fluminis]|uniref:septation ring formation regulator EzrA n=1 Tax=Brevibacillus fluminis TaxID=511487 RepID=UPI003F8BCA3A